MGNRIGRWAVIAVLENGQTLTGQNRPAFPRREADAALRGAEHQRLRSIRRQRDEADMRAHDRRVREILGVPVR